jgi:hypothetical protein
MISLNALILFQEKWFVNCRSTFFGQMKFSRIKTRIKTIKKVFTVFQYPHLIEVTTWIDFVTVWLQSSSDCRQNVSHIYSPFLCWSWILMKIWYSQYKLEYSSYTPLNRILIWWHEWLVISLRFFVVITNILASRNIRVLCNGKYFD